MCINVTLTEIAGGLVTTLLPFLSEFFFLIFICFRSESVRTEDGRNKREREEQIRKKIWGGGGGGQKYQVYRSNKA